ncbi:unnamed protein product [Bursaphelenchus okinawaensis]|uniref:Palmitoyltransferase n=1 Tax=Bursaphelenchus okinawaensis TaxID=465554 RepID=A0A811JR32_9BILA|nr:unnamed protein product [Bursaphelenchus okinawaensis]CAG9079307.1 unnamed protein product [Bursaphelenchus okinawaensis]
MRVFFCRCGRSSNGTIYEGRNHCWGQRWCNKDICGLFCAAFTWFLMGYGEFCVIFIFMSTASVRPIVQGLNFILFQTFAILAFLSHLRTMMTDPGAVPKGTLTDEYYKHMQAQQTRGEPLYQCHKCAAIKPSRAHHCSVCDRCIKRMDHHCPWVNNCVGEGNQRYFVLFTLYIACMSLHALFWTICQFVQCVNTDFRGCSYFNGPATTIMLIFLLFETILFSIFTLVMFGTQLSAICSDQTGIESLRKENHKANDGMKNMQVVFGGPFSLDWFNPLSNRFVSEKAYEFSV